MTTLNYKDSLLFYTPRPDVIMAKGAGMTLWDQQGKQYLDFLGGWAVNALGHCPEVIINTLHKQAQTLINASPAFYNEPMLAYANLLSQNSCFDRAFFTSTGAEANESAIKLARKFGAKHKSGAFEIITTLKGFHGRTLATMSATGKDKWKPLFEPKVNGFVQVPYNDLAAVEAAINPNTCAIMIEPVQGEGGVYPATPAYMTGLRALCDQHNVLLILDEVQTGFGRTGKLFCYEHYGIEPDVITLGKGIGGGFPLSAMLTKEKYNIFDPGDQGGTYTGQPLAMAVGYAVLKEILDKKLSQSAHAQGEKIKARLRDISAEFGLESIRGQGLLIGFDMAAKNAPEIAKACFDNGLIINASSECTLRLVPPLIVGDEDIEKFFDIFQKTIKGVAF